MALSRWLYPSRTSRKDEVAGRLNALITGDGAMARLELSLESLSKGAGLQPIRCETCGSGVRRIERSWHTYPCWVPVGARVGLGMPFQ